jgi:hypothetical protein
LEKCQPEQPFQKLQAFVDSQLTKLLVHTDAQTQKVDAGAEGGTITILSLERFSDLAMTSTRRKRGETRMVGCGFHTSSWSRWEIIMRQ